MLEKPDLPNQLIIARLWDEYRLAVRQLEFLPLGADVNTAVYRVTGADECAYFLKLRSGKFEAITVTVPQFLHAQGIGAIITPLETLTKQPWADLGAFKMVLYPFIEGKDGYEARLSDRQWLTFGAALKMIHAAHLPAALTRQIPRESFSPYWREIVEAFQAQVEENTFADPVADQVAQVMRANRGKIQHLVTRANDLGLALRDRSAKMVLCHSDLHPGNLLIGADGALYIVDWDNPSFALKERDLQLIGGSPFWKRARDIALFYQGYSPAEVDPAAMAYYCYERIIQDIAAYCQELLLTDAGGKDRERSLGYFAGQFLPDHEIDIALQRDPLKD